MPVIDLGQVGMPAIVNRALVAGRFVDKRRSMGGEPPRRACQSAKSAMNA
jgi:hypothetical protein